MADEKEFEYEKCEREGCDNRTVLQTITFEDGEFGEPNYVDVCRVCYKEIYDLSMKKTKHPSLADVWKALKVLWRD